MKSKLLDLFRTIQYKLLLLKNRILNKSHKVASIKFKAKTTETLTYKIWVYFVMFATMILIVLWFMQIIFLQGYYSSMKKSEVIKLAYQIEELYNSDGIEEYIDNIAYKNALGIYIVSLNKEIVYSSNGDPYKTIPGTSKIISIDFSSIIDEIKNSANNRISYTSKLEKIKSEIFIYGKQINNTDNCIIMVASIDPIDSTISVLKVQLLYVTIISLLFSSIISVFISKKLSSPIRKINETARKLATGNYNIKFEKAGYTEIDDLADTLNFTTQELEKTDKIRKELMANVSHDLKTPLTMIKAYSEMIRDLSGDNKEKREEHLQVIIDETDRLSRLVNDMMDLSKIESGVIRLNKERINLSEITKNIVNGFQILKENEMCNFKIEIQENIFVVADKVKIEQVIYNLVNNAISHSLDNKQIEIKLKGFGRRVRFDVIDNGPGISKENLKHIWTRYYRVDKTYKRADNGTGLGLSIVKNILDKHDANYGVKSEINVGSDFWFELERDIRKNVDNKKNNENKKT